MSLANDILGMTDSEILEIDTPRVHSKDQINFCGPISRNVRVAAGLVVFPDEIDQERSALEKNKLSKKDNGRKR